MDWHSVIVKAAVLVALCVWFFWPEICWGFNAARHYGNWAHALALPVVLVALVYLRRDRLAESLSGGSVWGIVALVGGLAFYAFASRWPLQFAYAGRMVIVPVLGAVVLATCGWRVLKHSLPLLMLVVLSIPLGQRLYAGLIIRPETYTLAATRVALDQLPGVDVLLDGPDLTYVYGQRRGAIALGELNRGASGFFACGTVALFVIFARIRPLWQVILLVMAAVPITLLCNLLRLCTWGVVTVYSGAVPTNATPRAVAVIVSLLAAYATCGLLCAVVSNLFVEIEVVDEPEVHEDE